MTGLYKVFLIRRNIYNKTESIVQGRLFSIIQSLQYKTQFLV